MFVGTDFMDSLCIEDLDGMEKLGEGYQRGMGSEG